jgi:UDP-GlcNAc:undecaprenyl-phosphate/decaprenyl-phosphate GlcNAc-1-phosphate transferase
VLIFVLACFLTAFVLSAGTTAAMRVIAPKVGLIDRPAARKVHTTPTPLGGGIGVVCGFVVTMALVHLSVWILARDPTPPSWLPATLQPHLAGVLERAGQLWMLIAAGVLLAVMGLLDDLRGLPWKARLFVQFALAIGLVAGGVQATVFVSHPWVGRTLTVLWIVVLINSFNFLDNMDALSSGIGLIAAVMFATVMLGMVSEPRWFVGGSLLALAGALAGFLCHNWPPARIFMGDAGSTFIGLILACLTVLGTFYDENIGSRHVMLAPLCILAIPLYDICSVVLIRLSEGRSPFQPDKKHFSHRLTEMGLSKRDAVLVVHLTTITTGLGALLLYRLSDWTGAALVLALVLCLLTIVAILETVGRSRANGDDASPPVTPMPPPPVAEA